MRVGKALFGLAIGLLGASGAGGASAACKMNLLAELPVHMVAGQPRVSLLVNGHEADALISTGSQQSVVRSWSKARLGVSAVNVDAQMEMKHGSEPARAAEVETIQLGKLVLKRVPMFVAGSDRIDRSDEDMVLGSNFFSEVDLELDLPHAMVRVFKPDGCKDDEVLYWGGAYSVVPVLLASEGQHEPRINVTVNGHVFEALLSSGSFNSYLSASAARTAGSRPAPGATTEWELSRRRPRTFDSISIDQETLKNVTLDVVEVKQVFDQNPTGRLLQARVETEPMVIGADFLAAHRVLISNGQHRIYFTFEKGPAFVPTTPTAGADSKD